VDEVDLLEYLANDRNTSAVAIYLEGTRRGRLLFETLKKVTKKKPVVALKAGRTSAGSAAVSSHTGSLAGAAEIYSGMFRQAGVIEARSVEELFGFAKALAYQPLPRSDRIAIVTNGGGFGVLSADAIIENGLGLASLDKKTLDEVRSKVPAYVTVSNPMDLTGDADSKRYDIALSNVLKDSNVDGIIVTLLLQISALESDIINVLLKYRKPKQQKPILVCSTGGEFTNIHRKMLEASGIPTYSSPEAAVKAMKALIDYSQTR
jgi:acyl-CoA synthetase (NDP forming)